MVNYIVVIRFVNWCWVLVTTHMQHSSSAFLRHDEQSAIENISFSFFIRFFLREEGLNEELRSLMVMGSASGQAGAAGRCTVPLGPIYGEATHQMLYGLRPVFQPNVVV